MMMFCIDYAGVLFPQAIIMSSTGFFTTMKSLIKRNLKMTSIQASSPPSYVMNEKSSSERRWLLSSIVFVSGVVIAAEDFAITSRLRSLEEEMEAGHKKVEAQQKKTQMMAAKLQHSIERLTSVMENVGEEEREKTLLAERSTVEL